MGLRKWIIQTRIKQLKERIKKYEYWLKNYDLSERKNKILKTWIQNDKRDLAYKKKELLLLEMKRK